MIIGEIVIIPVMVSGITNNDGASTPWVMCNLNKYHVKTPIPPIAASTIVVIIMCINKRRYFDRRFDV